MPSLSAKGFVNTTIVLAMMLMTSLTQSTHDDQSTTECDAHVIERLDDVTGRLTNLQRDVTAALRTTPADSVSSRECEGGNMEQLQSDVSAIRHAMELIGVSHPKLTNRTWEGKCLPAVVALFPPL